MDLIAATADRAVGGDVAGRSDTGANSITGQWPEAPPPPGGRDGGDVAPKRRHRGPGGEGGDVDLIATADMGRVGARCI